MRLEKLENKRKRGKLINQNYMTVEKLKKGQQIQDDLRLIGDQLKRLADSKYTLLCELTHPCSRNIESEDLQQLNERATAYAMSLLNTKVKELQKEFSKL